MEIKFSTLPDNLNPNLKSKIIIIFQSIIIVFLLLLIYIIMSFHTNKASSKLSNNIEKENYIPLPSWNDCAAKSNLIEYINNISNIPKEYRIAVFDLDGTLFQESDPVYNDWKLYQYRILNDSNYKATEEQIKIANKLTKAIKSHEMPDDLNVEISYSAADVFKNMTLEEYEKYLKDFLKKPSDGYNNLLRENAFFIPMLEVIDFLQKNDFDIFIVSATDRYQVRTVIDGHINIPKSNIIGSDYDISTINQGNKEGFDYKYNINEKLVLKGDLITMNIKFNKIKGIITNIGRKPILIFGNSEGDSSMANFVVSNNEYKSLAFMVLNDDLERERGNLVEAEKMKDLCHKNNWVPISMKNDWKTIYGENVTKNNISY